MAGLTLAAGLLLPWLVGIAVVARRALRLASARRAGRDRLDRRRGLLRRRVPADAVDARVVDRRRALRRRSRSVRRCSRLPSRWASSRGVATATRAPRALRAALRRARRSAGARRAARAWAWRLLLAWIALRFVLLGARGPVAAALSVGRVDAVGDQGARLVRARPDRPVREMPSNGSRRTAPRISTRRPDHPPTLPLLQVWTLHRARPLGRCADELALVADRRRARARGVRRAAIARRCPRSRALVGTFLVASLPLANVHVALAGYADLPLAAYYACAALALLRFAATRDLRRRRARRACSRSPARRSRAPGLGWAATLVPGVDRRARARQRASRSPRRYWRRCCSCSPCSRRRASSSMGHALHLAIRSGVAGARRKLLPARQLESAVVRRACRDRRSPGRASRCRRRSRR